MPEGVKRTRLFHAVTNQNSTDAFSDYAVWNGVDGIRAALDTRITNNANSISSLNTNLTALSDALNTVKGNYVTTNTVQNISGVKTFNANVAIGTDKRLDIVGASAKIAYTSTRSVIHGGKDGAAETDCNLRFGSWYGIGWYNTCASGQSATFALGNNAMWLNVRTGHLYVQGGYHIKNGSSSEFLKADGSVDSTAYLPASSYTAADVLAKIKTVDGSGSGLDADLLDGLHLDSVRGYRVNHPSINAALSVGNVPFNAFGMQHGTPMYNDPEFASGNNNVYVYNNSGNGNVTITRIADTQSSANSSGQILQIKVGGAASPENGGFYQPINSRANAVFMQIFRAKIPAGYSLNAASNSMGNAKSDVWLTSTAGTGKWEWYARITYCGASGSFGMGGHVYLSGTTPTASAPLYWYLSHCQLWDLTKNNYGAFRAKFADRLSTTRKIWGNDFDGSADVTECLHITHDSVGNYTQGIRINQISSSNMSSIWLATSNPTGYDAGMWGISATKTGNLRFRGGATAAADLMVITQAGNVGIGITNPAYKVDINGTVHSNSMFIRDTYAGSGWNSGHGALNVGIVNNSNQTPLMVAYRAGQTPSATGADRLFAMELLNDGTGLRFSFGGAMKLTMYSSGSLEVTNNETVAGLLTAKGGVTIPSGKTLKIGSIILEEVNGALHVNKGVYSDDFISARGADAASGGGGSLFGLINVWPTSDPGKNTTDALGANLGYALHTRVTALEGKNYLDALNVTTTGSGNAVTAVALSTDKKLITVTKGATFLTAHQAVSNKAATLAWNAATTIATVGATNITVKLPVNPNTDTKNTAGSTNTSSKIFLIGAASQAANPQTYSHDTAYVGTDGCLYSGGAKVLDETNYAGILDGRYYTEAEVTAKLATKVSKSGDTMTGALTLTSGNSSAYDKTALSFIKTGTTTEQARIGTDAANAIGVYATGSIYLRPNVTLGTYSTNGIVLSSSSITFNNNKIWHAGNDGSGSGLDADLLDGVHNGYLTANKINANGTPQGDHALTWFSGQATIGTAAGNAYKGSSTSQALWSFPDGGTAADSAAGGVANIMNLRLGWNASYWADIFTSPNYERLWYRLVSNGSAKAWKQIAFTSDNVASANKLYTARKINGTAFNGTADITTSTWGATRTLWGRSCNGSANISGDMTDVGSIKMNSAIFLTRPNSAGKGIYLQGNDAGGASFYLHLNYAAVAGGNVMTFAYDRKVGVNTVSPSYTLDVNGSAIVRSVLRIGNESSTVSPAILSLSSGALKCNVGFYSDDFISARGQDTTSDARLKSFVESVSVDIAKIAAAPLWRFRWKDSGKMDAGSVAQYWQDVEPLLVNEHAGHLTLSYGKAAMLAAVTTARRLLEDERRIREHGDRIAQLEARVAELEAALSDGAKAEAAG